MFCSKEFYVTSILSQPQKPSSFRYVTILQWRWCDRLYFSFGKMGIIRLSLTEAIGPFVLQERLDAEEVFQIFPCPAMAMAVDPTFPPWFNELSCESAGNQNEERLTVGRDCN